MSPAGFALPVLSRFLRLVGTVAVATVLGCVGTASASAATWFVSPSGSDAASCVAGAACRSFARAYAVAAGGDVVQVAAGVYSSQSIPADASKGSVPVVFAGAGVSSVTIGDLSTQASAVQVQNMTVDVGGGHGAGD